MPPALFTFLSYPMTRLAHLLFPTAMANAVIAGSYVFCMFCPISPNFQLLTHMHSQTSYTIVCITRESHFCPVVSLQ